MKMLTLPLTKALKRMRARALKVTLDPKELIRIIIIKTKAVNIF